MVEELKGSVACARGFVLVWQVSPTWLAGLRRLRFLTQRATATPVSHRIVVADLPASANEQLALGRSAAAAIATGDPRGGPGHRRLGPRHAPMLAR
jgi:hypothetical protein